MNPALNQTPQMPQDDDDFGVFATVDDEDTNNKIIRKSRTSAICKPFMEHF